MPDTYPTPELTADASAPVTVRRADGSEAPARLRLLSFDGCELECGKRFKSGEEVNIRLYRMGWIPAKVSSCRSKIVEAEFVKE